MSEFSQSSLPQILVVDDIPENLQIVGETLSRNIACDLAFATDGPQALESVKEIRPDLILLDVMMPGMTGFQVCKTLKSDPETAHIPVLFLTAKVETSDVVAGFEAGAVDYITKPFNPPELVSRVKTQLNLRQTAAYLAVKNDELRQLLHILCHDLANPVGNILALSRMMDDPTQIERIRHMIEISANGALDLIEMVRQMRALEEGKLKVALQPIELASACREAEASLQTKFLQKRMRLELDVPPGLKAKAEPVMLVNSVLCNLLTNAIKFSRSGSTVWISAAALEDGNVMLAIRDEGIGIPPELLETLFDMNAQTSRPGTEGEIGTGFGMPQARKFIAMFGGTITVASKDIQSHPADHGTTVTIMLPRG